MRYGMVSIFVLLWLVSAGCPRGGARSTTPDGAEGGDEGEGDTFETEVPEPEPPSPVDVRLRVIHAAATALKAPVLVSRGAEDEQEGIGEAVAYGASTSYVEVILEPGSTEVELAASAEGFEGPAATVPVTTGSRHTVIVFSDPETARELVVASLEDMDEPPEEEIRARFFNGVVGWEEVDVCLPGETPRAPGEPLFAGAGYGGAAAEGYVSLAADAGRIQFREAEEEEPCSGRIIGRVDLRPPEGVELASQYLTFVAVGRNRGRPAAPRGVLVCLDAPAETTPCFRLPMRQR